MTDAVPPRVLTTRDKLRRMATVLFVLACLAGLGVAVSHTREIDANGDVITDSPDDGDVAISGDEELIDQLPPTRASGIPAAEDVVRATLPADGSAIPHQFQIGVELGDGYRVARFYLQDTLLRDDELVRNEAVNGAYYLPAEGHTFEDLPAGSVCARVDVVRAIEADTVVRAVEWCFEVL